MATRPEEPGVTELRARTAELERERELLNAIANHAPSLLCLVDADGRVRPLATNIAFERHSVTTRARAAVTSSGALRAGRGRRCRA